MKNKKMTHPVVMVIGGMDPSGGAGLCADIQTLARLGCHAAPVTTAVTVQDTIAVSEFSVEETALIEAQMIAVLNDLKPKVVKTGMLANRAIISVVASVLKEYPHIQLIVDPVMSSNNNEALSECSLAETIRGLLLPVATLITPNIPEARMLADKGTDKGTDKDTDINTNLNTRKDADPDDCAAAMDVANCIITGTHAETSSVINSYYQHGRKVRDWRWPRLQHEYHGSGCTLASAVAAALAHGLEMEKALDMAQRFVIASLQADYNPGRGQHIPDRLCPDAPVTE